jgi:hypothetical protein
MGLYMSTFISDGKLMCFYITNIGYVHYTGLSIDRAPHHDLRCIQAPEPSAPTKLPTLSPRV